MLWNGVARERERETENPRSDKRGGGARTCSVVPSAVRHLVMIVRVYGACALHLPVQTNEPPVQTPTTRLLCYTLYGGTVDTQS